MMRVTVSITVADDYNTSTASLRAMKNDMIETAMGRVRSSSLNVHAIEAKIGNVHKAKGSS